MVFRRSILLKYLVAAIVGALIYTEWIVYEVQSRYWYTLKCREFDLSCTKILFIADPQIQGDTALPPPLSYLVNWDSDQYLKSTFSVVMRTFLPDVLVFMGDLMDEGSISTTAQFHNYAKRLFNIFDIQYPVTIVWLPGDNDIGGENEPIRLDKIKEFAEVFKQPSVITYKNISFYKVDPILRNIPEKNTNENANISIVVSHFPVTVRTSFSQMVNNRLQPNIYFCAHDHKSKYITQNKNLVFKETTEFRDGDPPLEITFSEDIKYEIFVPTCSYRMGTNKIGYGAAVLESNNRKMRYTVFWSSERFPFLMFYLVVVGLASVYVAIYFTFKKLITRRTTALKTKTPLA
ncbi:uncharacterized protein LOC113226144 [Hyposmocoma kahamanoa]|uniref:uncharacterized protein LOC113226144 n=1 Tax=Hyposmocoma kahamanoa TaxID=1477025 RepID=UPI000E6D9FA5|nr:uncharacterized protein LOC113226144 [Hyposmocoma kahamanoa]